MKDCIHMTKRKGAHGDDCDVLVIGSGLGGNIAAVELSEKGDRMRISAVWCKAFDKTFAETDWNIERFVWAPLELTDAPRIYSLAKAMVHIRVDDVVNRCRRSILIKQRGRLVEIAERAVGRNPVGRMSFRAR
jgi:flavin-dependent dehydrogenase